MVTRVGRATLALVLVVGCTSVTPAGTLPPATPDPGESAVPGTAQPTATEPTFSPSATAPTVATEHPTATPTKAPTIAPRPSANARKGDPIMIVSSSSGGYVTAQVILPVFNTGNTWIKLSEYESAYTIYDAEGGIVDSGNFDSAAPKRIAPTGMSYLVGESFSNDYPRSAYNHVEADAYFDEVNGPIDPELSVGNTRVSKGSFGGLKVVGEVTNLGTERVDNGDVVAIFFNANGDVIGFASGYVENVEPGGKRAFELSTSFAEISLGDLAETQFFASPWDF